MSDWKSEVREHFSRLKLSQDFHDDLTHRLMNQGPEGSKSQPLRARAEVQEQIGKLVTPPGIWKRGLAMAHRSGAGYLASVVLAASVTFAIMDAGTESENDPIAELANQPGPKSLPADFDLEGNADAFGELMQEAFPKQEFMLSQLPKEVMGGYKPSEARLFFTGSGQPGVSIQLLNPTNKQDANSTTILYIVQLSDSNSKGFPKERKLIRNLVSKSGKQKRVNAWRDEKFGYAMVQSVALSDTGLDDKRP